MNSSLEREKQGLEIEKEKLVTLLKRKIDDVDRLVAKLKLNPEQLLHEHGEKCQAIVESKEMLEAGSSDDVLVDVETTDVYNSAQLEHLAENGKLQGVRNECLVYVFAD